MLGETTVIIMRYGNVNLDLSACPGSSLSPVCDESTAGAQTFSHIIWHACN